MTDSQYLGLVVMLSFIFVTLIDIALTLRGKK